MGELTERDEYQPKFVKQIKNILDEDTTWVDIGKKADVDLYSYGDSYTSWHFSISFRAMFLALLWAHVEDESISAIPTQLAQKPELASAFGFDPEDLPAPSTFRRTWNNRFEDLHSTIERSAEQICDIAAQQGCPIGTSALRPSDSAGSSKRTENRLIRQKIPEVMDEMKNVVFPELALPRPDNAVYSEDDLLQLEALMGLKHLAANEGGDILGDKLNPNPNLDDPYYEDGPSGETLLEDIKQLSAWEISTMVNNACQKTLTRAKPHIEFERPVQLAIDITYVAYYGDRDELEWVQGAPSNKEYEWCHKFATAAIVGENIHFTIAMLPVGNKKQDPVEYPGKRKSYRPANVMRNLLDIVLDQVSVEVVYADRGFYAAETISVLEYHNLLYVIPAVRTTSVHRELDRMDDQVTVKDDVIYGPRKGESTQEPVRTTLVLLPPGEGYDSKQAFITNLEVDDEIGLDRRITERKINRYTLRGGIETSYKKVKEFAAWTTSKAFEVRLFHFGMAVLLYNMWLLVDFLVQVAIYDEFRSKPRITARRFLEMVNQRLSTLLG